MSGDRAKSGLSKLLAKENIKFKHDSSVKTASFDVKARVLTLPVWENISNDLYDMLIVHETGHALDTPYEGWKSGIEKIAKDIYKDKFTPNHHSAIQGFANVVEDARIDRLQKIRYPGSKRNYYNGYWELIHSRDFFQLRQGKFRIKTLPFIDRANIYFKGGNTEFEFFFTKEEKAFIKKMKETQTFDDVLELTKEIFLWSKTQVNTSAPPKVSTPTEDFGDDEDEEGESGFSFSDDSDDEGAGTEASDDEGAEGDDAQENSNETPGKSGNGIGEGAGEVSENNDQTPPEDEKIPESVTENLWKESMEILGSNETLYIYNNLPEIDPTIKVVTPYKEALSKIRESNKSSGTQWEEIVRKNLNEFMVKERENISYMIKEFQMKQAAAQAAKVQISKTGVLNMNKIFSAAYNDDIFKRNMNLPQGKNHGIVMFVDWSGSMQVNLDSTIKQLISLVMFCRSLQIPFDVYTFGSQFAGANPFKNGEVSVGHFNMGHMLSSKMNIHEINEMFLNLYKMATGNYNIHYGPNGGTPLNDSIVYASKIVKDFRKANNVEIVNVVFITDGESQPTYFKSKYQYHPGKKRNFIVDPETHTEYEMGIILDKSVREHTSIFLKVLKKRTGANVIGFFLNSSGWAMTCKNNLGMDPKVHGFDMKVHAELGKKYSRDGYVALKNVGYDSYFVISCQRMKNQIEEFDDFVEKNGTKRKVISETAKHNAITSDFMKFAEAKKNNRAMLKEVVNQLVKQIG